MMTSDELTEGIINKPKNTPLHNRLEQKNIKEPRKLPPNMRYASPPMLTYTYGQDLKKTPINKDIKIEKQVGEQIVAKVDHNKPTKYIVKQAVTKMQSSPKKLAHSGKSNSNNKALNSSITLHYNYQIGLVSSRNTIMVGDQEANANYEQPIM